MVDLLVEFAPWRVHIYILPCCSTAAVTMLNLAGDGAQFARSRCSIPGGILTLGHKAFESYSEEQPNKRGENPIFSVSVGSGKAYGIRTADGFVLLKDSSIHEVSSDSLNIGIKKRVEQSRASGEIKDGILQNDKLFSSSSAAAAFATGYSISGPQQWKTDSGETLKSFETTGAEQA